MSAEPSLQDDIRYRWMEYAVPVLGFGGALLGIAVWMADVTIDIRFSILGCVLASWVLAYLAWVRPKKDIVALTTPIYSFIFLGFPIDNFSAVVLELLYAASLTILLVRLKYRFGVPKALVIDKKDLAEPLRSYVEKIREPCAALTPEQAHSAAVVFVRFAEGEFHAAALAAEFAIAPSGVDMPHCVKTAFAIVKEQSERLDTSLPRPDTFLAFSRDDASLLAKVPDPKFGKPEEYDITLENALLLLFAVAWNRSESDRAHLHQCHAFVVKLLGD